MTKALNHYVEDEIHDLFEQTANKLGMKKKVMECCIEVFAALPRGIQFVLMSQSEEDRKAILDRIRSMNQKSTKGKRA